jgi:hypothetical protein
MDSLAYAAFAYSPLPGTYPSEIFHSFHLDKNTMEYSISMVRFLLKRARIAFLPGNNG